MEKNSYKIEIEFGVTEDLERITHICSMIEESYNAFEELHMLTCDKPCLDVLPSRELIRQKIYKLNHHKAEFAFKKRQPHSQPTWFSLWKQVHDLALEVSQINGVIIGVIRVHNQVMLNVSNFFECEFHALAFEQII